MQPDNESAQMLMKFKFSVLNVVINQPNALLFISTVALMQSMLKLRTDYELLHIL